MSGVVHFKFRSALSYDSVSFDGHYISIAELKRLIADKKGLGADASAELELSDPQTKQAYADDAHQLPRNSSVVVRRVPVAKAPGRGPPPNARGGVASTSAPEPAAPAYPAAPAAAAGTSKAEFGEDPLEDQAARLKASYEDETSRIDAVVSAQDEAWRQDTERGILAGRGGGGRGGPGGRGGRGSGRLRPPETYWCKICGAQGQHWVQECPRRHDANLDLKIVRAPAGIPMTLLSRSTEGGLLLPNGEIGALKHSDDAFEREMAGLPSNEPRKADSTLPALADRPTGDRAPSPAVPALPAPAAATPERSPGPAAAPSRLPVKLEQRSPPATSELGATEAAAAAPVAAVVESRELVLVEPTPGLFDDDDLMADGDEAPVQLGLGMGMVVAEEQQPDSARAADREVHGAGRSGREGAVPRLRADAGRQRSPPRDPDELVPEDINTLLPMLKGILPRGPLGALLRAFKPGRPLSSEQFAELRADYGRPPPMARVASGHSAGDRRSLRSPSRDLSRRLSPPGRHHLAPPRISRDGAFDRDMGFDRMGGFDRFGPAFDRQPPMERRWRSRSPSPERSRSHSLSRRERARSPIAPIDAFSRPGFREDRVMDRGVERHVERRISQDVPSWREEPSWREQPSWREEPVIKLEERRPSRSDVEGVRQLERERKRGSGDGGRDGQRLGPAHIDGVHEPRKARGEDGGAEKKRSHKHSRTSKRAHGSQGAGASADAAVANGDGGHDEERAKRRRSSSGHKDGSRLAHAGDNVADARWLETHPSMREASADLANLLDDSPNGHLPASHLEAHHSPSPAAGSPAGAAALADVYLLNHTVPRSRSASPARGQQLHGEPADANGGQYGSAAADAEHEQPAAIKQEAAGGDQSPKRREGSSRHNHKEKKSSKERHKSSHKSKKEKHKDKQKEDEPADEHGGKHSRGPSQPGTRGPSRSPSPQPTGDDSRHMERHYAAAEPPRQPSPQPRRAAAADRPTRVRSDGQQPQGLFGKALLGAVGRAGPEAGKQLSPAKRRPSVKVEEGAHDDGNDSRTHKRSRRD